MNALELAGLAWKSDPFSCTIAIAAGSWVLVSGLNRKGGLDAGYIIEVFGYAATLGTVPKVIYWAGCELAGAPNSHAPSGTDCLLIAGGCVAIMFSAIEGIGHAAEGSSDKPSRITRVRQSIASFPIWPRLMEEARRVSFVARVFPPEPREPMIETAQAKAEREQLQATGATPEAPAE